MKIRKNESGSALFIIIIAVVLFAALSYTVAEMMRGGDPETMSQETAKLNATELLNHGRTIRQTVQTMKISNGCANEDISFENNIVTGYDHTPVADDKCKVFDAAGGGLAWSNPAPGVSGLNTYFFSGGLIVSDLGDNSEPELTMILRGVSRKLCEELNKSLGLDKPENDNSASANFYTTKFQDTYAAAGDLGSAVNAGSAIYDGRPAGCFRENTTAGGDYFFYQVLLSR